MATKKEKKELEEVMEEKKEEIKKSEDKVGNFLQEKKKERLRRKDLLKKIDKDTGILIMNNISNGGFFYQCPVNKTIYRFSNYGDTDYMTFDELNIMKNQYRGILENYYIIPIDLDTDEVELDDVLDLLGIKKLYDEEMMYEENIDYILLNLDMDTFKALIKRTKKPYVMRVVDRAIELTRKGRFNDFGKMSYIEKLIGQEDLFKNIIDSE